MTWGHSIQLQDVTDLLSIGRFHYDQQNDLQNPFHPVSVCLPIYVSLSLCYHPHPQHKGASVTLDHNIQLQDVTCLLSIGRFHYDQQNDLQNLFLCLRLFFYFCHLCLLMPL